LTICMGGEGMGGIIGPKITILTPTFNDAKFIPQMLESVITQDYKNWELLIYDDASTDNTEQVLMPFLRDRRILYYRGEKNMDQLNALYQLAPHVTGDIVTLLHSDDTFSDSSALSRTVRAFEKDIDGVYADLVVVDAKCVPRHRIKTPQKISEDTLQEAFLALGSNIVTDCFFVKRNVFQSNVLKSYVLWNVFYWMVLGGNQPKVLKLAKVKPWYNYRVCGEGYLNVSNEARSAFVLNGMYRTIIELSWFYELSLPNCFRFFMKVPKVRSFVRKGKRLFLSKARDLSLEGIYRRFEANACLLEEMLRRHGSQRVDPNIMDFFMAPIICMRNLKKNKEMLVINGLDGSEPRYLGKDARCFFESVLSGKDLPAVYVDLVKKAPVLKAVYVSKQEEVFRIRDILRFLCLPLPILVGNEFLDAEINLIEGFRRRFSWT